MMQQKKTSRSNYKEQRVQFQPLNNSQRLHWVSMQDKDNDVVFVTGPAGVGKSFVSLSYAAQQYKENGKDIIITRSLVGVDQEEVGFLKGDLDEKLQPWMSVFIEPLIEILGKGAVEVGLKSDKKGQRIRIEPITFMRGRTFEDCTLIITEGQNTSWQQMKTLLTRQGEYSKFIIEGDLGQCDRKDIEINGLQQALTLIKNQGMNIPTVQYTANDCVRSGMVKKWLEAMEKEGI